MSMDRTPALGQRGTENFLAGLIRRTMNNILTTLQPALSWRPGKRDAAELFLIAIALPLYYLVRGVAHARVDQAMDRGMDLVRLEQKLGIFWETDLQRLIIDHDFLVSFFNNLYLYGHLPVIGVLALWLYLWHRPQYLLMRNAFLLSGAIGLVFYVMFPTAPPRMLPAEFGFVDTVLHEYSESRPLTPSFFVNEYAAMPSLHMGWNLLVGIAVWLATKNIFMRSFAVVMPVAMLATIILTANHYIVDAVAGVGVMFLGMFIALSAREMVRQYHRRNGNRRPSALHGWLYWLCGLPDTEQQRTPRGTSA